MSIYYCKSKQQLVVNSGFETWIVLVLRVQVFKIEIKREARKNNFSLITEAFHQTLDEWHQDNMSSVVYATYRDRLSRYYIKHLIGTREPAQNIQSVLKIPTYIFSELRWFYDHLSPSVHLPLTTAILIGCSSLESLFNININNVSWFLVWLILRDSEIVMLKNLWTKDHWIREAYVL